MALLIYLQNWILLLEKRDGGITLLLNIIIVILNLIQDLCLMLTKYYSAK